MTTKYPYDVMITTGGKTYCGESDWYKSSALRRFRMESQCPETERVEIIQNGVIIKSLARKSGD